MTEILYGLRFIRKHNIKTSYTERREFIMEHGYSVSQLYKTGTIDSNINLKGE